MLPLPALLSRLPLAGGLALMLACAAQAQAQPVDGDADPTAGGEPPVISPEDTDIGDMVMDGPFEPAGAVGWDEDFDSGLGGGMSLTETGQPRRRAGDAPASPATAPPAPPVPAPATASAEASQAPAAAVAVASPVVVELFTAQGCSSCPPADALLSELSGRPDVLPLSFHVDYWDYLGWADSFARPEFTARQQAYGRSSGERAIYTPQIIVGGEDTLIDLAPAGLDSMIAEQAGEGRAVMVGLSQSGGVTRLTLTPRTRIGAVTVELVRYVPRREQRIAAGENRGRVLVYRNVVLSVERLATWDGRTPLLLTVTPRAGEAQPLPPDTRHAVLVQTVARTRGLGPILAAAALD